MAVVRDLKASELEGLGTAIAANIDYQVDVPVRCFPGILLDNARVQDRAKSSFRRRAKLAVEAGPDPLKFWIPTG